jgi:uncharacterized membrane protein YcaP (DUF421 family)
LNDFYILGKNILTDPKKGMIFITIIRPLFRTFLIYFFLILIMRLLGKRQIGQLQLSELISALLLSEIAAGPITDHSISIVETILSILLIFALETILPFFTYKYPLFRKWIDGSPSYLMDKGQLNPQEMRKNRISPEELLTILQSNGVNSPNEVEYVILEPSGSLSILLKTNRQPITPESLGLCDQQEAGIAHAIILQGMYNRSVMKHIQMSEEDVDDILKAKGVCKEDVYLMTINEAKEIFLVKQKKSKSRSQ